MNLEAKSILGLCLTALVASASAQPEFSLTQLPEGAGAASEPLAMHVGNDPPELTVVGRVLDGSGIWQAAVWTNVDPAVFVLDITFHDLTTASEVSDVGDFNGDGRADLLAGSQGNPGSELPKMWRLDESGKLGCTWCEDTVNLPAGSDSKGNVSDINMPNTGSGKRFAGGWSAGADGIRKATVWEWDGSVWQAALLPELATDSMVSRASVARNGSRPRDPDSVMRIFECGSAEDDNGNENPVIWTFSDADGSWSITELPLLPGGISGDVRDGIIDDVDGTVTLVGSSETDPVGLGPVRHAAYWQCSFTTTDCSLSASWIVFDLPVPALLLHCTSYCYLRQTVSMVGTCNDGAGTEVGTLWEVDFSVTPATVTVHDLNSLVSDLPDNVTLTGAFAITGRGTVATGRIETGLVSATAGVSDLHAFFLETVEPAIPAASTWGLAAMLLALMTTGTILITRHRGSRVA